jgi:hypothetical protein
MAPWRHSIYIRGYWQREEGTESYCTLNPDKEVKSKNSKLKQGIRSCGHEMYLRKFLYSITTTF